MDSPRWSDLHPYWADDDGALLDLYVRSTNVHDWQRAVEAVRAFGWPSSYEENGPTPIPVDVRRIFPPDGHPDAVWKIEAPAGLQINCHFFVADEIEFDIDPRELIGQEQIDVLCELGRTIAIAVDRPVSLGIESASDPRPEPMLTYDPATDDWSAGA